MEHTLNQFLFPALMLFATGLLGAMFKRNLISIFMGIELMLCGAMLAFVAFASVYNNMDGAVFAFFILTIAAAEVAVGLAIITRLFKVENTISTKELNTLGD
ncbi:MAG: NADH-quinone oxidoreductase subunit NuoK [Opitutales bacterium]|nr:NADH-quinone oxidoreductase subunit NuoK [Opitutales bacterium]MBP3357678.1 NADH-quinone oxidoreductase subunit NuoK [Opitutales bacterium]MBQ2722504.1 NADH-quinone oxidoreductase subunit NuoK [Opitutales bacterium]MBR7106283.1 NADH-quinone oxidoreductase subunit NuoK [Opitutales bacterium]